MSQISDEDHYARAGERHHIDAIYLHDDGRLPNADYHYGFAVECTLKSLLLRSEYATMSAAARPGGSPKPRAIQPDGSTKALGHLPYLWSTVAGVLHGRAAGMLSSALSGSAPFSDWSVDQRYRDGDTITEATVRRHRDAAVQILYLHQQAVISGRLP